MTRDGEQTRRKKTASYDTDGPPAHITASTVLGGSVIQERRLGQTRTDWRDAVKKDRQRLGTHLVRGTHLGR